MIEAIHKQLMSELDRAGRADTVFVVSGVLFNILVLFVNWAQASSLSEGRGNLMIYLLFTAGSLLISCTALLALINSRRICNSVHSALEQIYKDQNVAHYLPKGLSTLGNKRFILSFIVVGGTGLLAVIIPLLQMSASSNGP
ncbi:hypothetical protein ASD77_06735 [Pseudoxanthomonas sp. Root65]|uniref:hypothetical protein n=1 Tax=Pseudoxanthomonas sp. Root65 TaxID=1736576 RepID=UPI0006FF1A69|nr:hypothetical protein [Pseudoxanthomonas sp. Root65]KRA54309.1 hypothetical protein ASD77_06735 [Pseudoxanthomonas sp. Root65]